MPQPWTCVLARSRLRVTMSRCRGLEVRRLVLCGSAGRGPSTRGRVGMCPGWLPDWILHIPKLDAEGAKRAAG